MAQESAFASRQQAQDYLAATLPRATAENPKFRSADGTVSQWLTKDVTFAGGKITMRETYTQTKDGKTTPGAHESAFSLADVDFSEMTYPDDVTLDGAKAMGVLFACRKPGCISADWSGHKSQADKGDISLQNDATRAKILAAFRYLKTHAE